MAELKILTSSPSQQKEPEPYAVYAGKRQEVPGKIGLLAAFGQPEVALGCSGSLTTSAPN